MSQNVNDDEGYLPRGLHLANRRELYDALKRWRSESRAPTIGDVGTYGGKPWVSVQAGGHNVFFNADTKRVAIEEFLRRARSDPDRSWRVVANRRGRINKVLPDPYGTPLPGWFAYLHEDLAEEQTI